MVLFFVILALVFVLVLVIVSNIVIVPQSKVYVIERLGSYSDRFTPYSMVCVVVASVSTR